MAVTQYPSGFGINVRDKGWPITTAVVNAAMAALPATGGTLFFPAGVHTCDVEITRHGVILQGSGPRATTITGDITWNVTPVSEGYGDYPGYTSFRDLKVIGTVGVEDGPLPYWLEGFNCIFDNESIAEVWNLDMQGEDENDVGQNWYFEHCQFLNGGVRLRSINTATFMRCRFAWSGQDAAIWLERSQADSATEPCVAEFIGCVIEGNDELGVYLGPGAQRCVFQSCHFEGNQAAEGTGYGDIDIADFTIIGGWHAFRHNTFNASTSDYNIRFPDPATYHPPCIVEGNYFSGTPLHSGKHIHLGTYTGLLDKGSNRFQSTRAAAYDAPANLRESGPNTYAGSLEAFHRRSGKSVWHDASDNALVTIGDGSTYGEIQFRSTAKIKGDSTSRRMKTDDHLMILGGLTVPSKAGIPVDGDVVGAAAQAGIVIDLTNDRIYVRCASGWKYAALT